MKVLHCGIGNFALFCSYDLDLERRTFIHKPDPYPLKMYSQTKNKLSTSRFSKVIGNYIHSQANKQTPPKLIPHRFVGNNNNWEQKGIRSTKTFLLTLA